MLASFLCLEMIFMQCVQEVILLHLWTFQVPSPANLSHAITLDHPFGAGFDWKRLLQGMEKEMATHSSILAWRIPGTGEPVELLSMGLHRVGHDWSDLAAAAAAARDVGVSLPSRNGALLSFHCFLCCPDSWKLESIGECSRYYIEF